MIQLCNWMCFGQDSWMVRDRVSLNITQLKGGLLYGDRDNILNIWRLKMKSNGLYRVWFRSRKIRSVYSQSLSLSLPLSLSLSAPSSLLSPLCLPSWSLCCISLLIPDSLSAHFLLLTHNLCFSVILACVGLAPALTLNFIIFLFEAHQWLELPDPILGSSPCGMNCLWISCRTLVHLVWPVGWGLKKWTCSEESKDGWKNTVSPRRTWQEAWFLILNCGAWDEKYHRGQMHADWLSSH